MDNRTPEGTVLTPLFVRALTGAQFELYAFIAMVLGNREAAKDVLQDTNVMLMKHADEYDAQRPFLPWAKAFAFNQARAFVKRQSRTRMVFDDDLVTAVAEGSPAEPAESGREWTLLDLCLKRLTPDQTALIQARYYRQEKVERIAGRLKRSAISVYVQLHRIRRLLGACIEANLQTSEEGGRA